MKLDNVPHKFVQTSVSGVVLTSSNAAAVFGVKFFTTADITQFSSFAAVFDQYRFDEVEVWLSPSYNNATVSAQQLGTSAQIYSVVDYDDANTITQNGALQYSNVMASSINDGHYRRFKPHTAVAVYSGTFTGFKNVPAGWTDCASTTVQHYGMKFLMDAVPTAVQTALSLMTRVHISFRNTF